DAGLLLFLLCVVDNFLESLFRLFQCGRLFYQVVVMETVKGCADLSSEFKRSVHFVVCPLHGVGSSKPREILRGKTERIAARAAERMPIGNGESKVFLHRLLAYSTVRVVIPEGQRII